ncbi:MAG: hypothetical protein R3270_02775 [Gammaproteobacteria bacterium]|nr:hypothetical protein [Gammaproteobacteria bacterium]
MKQRNDRARNLVAKHARFVQKAGAHGKTKKALRQKDRQQLKREIRRNDESPFFMRKSLVLSAPAA